MSEIEILNSLREHLVAERRRVARLGVEFTDRAESWAVDVKRVQELIEAVDRAIVDEEKIESAEFDPTTMVA